ncbi:hypothetical protein LINGRAHAP2_LOCUS31105 [Linum grandiflorum]
MTICIAFVVITSHLILLSAISQVKADPALIPRTCDRSYHSDYCDACFNSMKGLTSHQDLRGLGGSTIYCAFRQILVAHDRLETCYSTKDGGESTRCYKCIDKLDSAIEHVMEGMQLWGKSSYADSKTQLESASNQVFDCSLGWIGLTLSPEELNVMSQVTDSNGYTYAASGTIEQLLPDYDPNTR